MKRAIHAQVGAAGRFPLVGLADGLPTKEHAWLTKQPLYLDRTGTITRFQFSDVLKDFWGKAGLTFKDFGFDLKETATVVGWLDFLVSKNAPLPPAVDALRTAGHLSVNDFNSLLLESPPSGALVGGPTLTAAALNVDITFTGTNLTSVAPVTSKLSVIAPGVIAGTDNASPKGFGGGTRYLFVRNNAGQSWLEVAFTGNMTPAACIAAFNAKVTTLVVNGRSLGGHYAFLPNMRMVVSSDALTPNAVDIVAFAGEARIEVAAEATVVAKYGAGTAANTILLGAGSAAGANSTGVVRGTVTSDLIAEGNGTDLTVLAADVPANTAIGDYLYLSLNNFDRLVRLTA